MPVKAQDQNSAADNISTHEQLEWTVWGRGKLKDLRVGERESSISEQNQEVYLIDIHWRRLVRGGHRSHTDGLKA